MASFQLWGTADPAKTTLLMFPAASDPREEVCLEVYHISSHSPGTVLEELVASGRSPPRVSVFTSTSIHACNLHSCRRRSPLLPEQ